MHGNRNGNGKEERKACRANPLTSGTKFPCFLYDFMGVLFLFPGLLIIPGFLVVPNCCLFLQAFQNASGNHCLHRSLAQLQTNGDH